MKFWFIFWKMILSLFVTPTQNFIEPEESKPVRKISAVTVKTSSIIKQKIPPGSISRKSTRV